MTSGRTNREAAVRWWVGPTCRLDEGVRAWCDGDDSVEVGHDVKRLADALDAAYARGVEDAAKACEADAIAYEDRSMLEMHTSRLAASLQQQSAMSLRVASETIRALAKGGPR